MIRRHPQATWGANGVLSVGGRALCGPPPAALASRWVGPYVGLPLSPVPSPMPIAGPAKIPLPAFPSQPAQPQNPVPQVPQVPQGPTLASLLATEAAAVGGALAIEVQAVEQVYGGGPLFAQAAAKWHDALQAATAISDQTQASAPVVSKNAAARAFAYYERQQKDELVAKDPSKHPKLTGEVKVSGYGWNWPPIPQDPEPGGFTPTLPPGSVPQPGTGPEATPAPQTGGGGALLAFGLGLLAVAAAVVYAGARKRT